MKYFYEVYHPKCSYVAFYIKDKPAKGETIEIDNVLLKTGRKPKTINDVKCGECGETIKILPKCIRRRMAYA